jgi:guanosine-3',5'-bis(diphosphate) 3'-pyrophosphohydrolase
VDQIYQIEINKLAALLKAKDDDLRRLNLASDMLSGYIATLEDVEQKKVVGQAEQFAIMLINELGLGITSVLVALLRKPFFTGSIDSDLILTAFGKEVHNLLRGFQKIENLDTSKTEIHTENFIQLIISLSPDVRLVLIKLVERLMNIRDVQNLSQKEQIQSAREGTVLYGPIAHRLGLYRIKTEFEEIGMKYLYPDDYKYIAKRLNETKRSRDNYIESFIKPLNSLINQKGYTCEIKGRPKSIYSIWKKMKSQEVDFEEVYDLFAIRIILDGQLKNEKADCWQVYSLVTDQYQPNPNRLRDWISSPKPNGYESLHTTVIGPDGKWVEVQIRTRRMDEIAEMGHAAHWKYKESKAEGSVDEWLSKIRVSLETPDQPEKRDHRAAKTELYSDQIYIFTPKNDLIKIKASATVLDFAFAVHTNVGCQCTGAKVNGRIVPIRHQLINGDTVEILTSTQQKPKLAWLNIVNTGKAKTRIKRVLKEAEFKNTDEGKETLRRKFEQWKIKYDVTTIHRLVNFLKMKDALQLYQAISENKVDLQEVRDFLKTKNPAEILKEKVAPEKGIENFVKSTVTQEDCLVIDEKLTRVDYKLAKCCNPIFGDEVYGFITVNEGTKIHRLNCPNAKQMIARYPYRVVKVRWTDQHGDDSHYTVNTTITGIDDIGILNEISKVISSDLRVNMRAMNITTNDGFFSGRITLVVADKNHLENVMNKVRQVKGVLNVQRSDEQ